MDTADLSSFEVIEDGLQVAAEVPDLVPAPQPGPVSSPAGRHGLTKAGKPKKPPGRKPAATPPKVDAVAAPPPSVSRPPTEARSAEVLPGQAVAGELLPAEPRKVPFLFTASTLAITSADRADRAKRHQLLFAGTAKLACDSMKRLAPSPNVCNPLAALIAMREETEQAHFLPTVATGIAAAQIVASVVLAKPIGQATAAEIESVNAEYAALVSGLGV